MGEEMINKGKIMTASTAPTIRRVVKIANELNIPREDVVTILPCSEGYTFIYYYGGD